MSQNFKNSVSKYFSSLQKEFKTGRAKEHSYRPALKQLIEDINPNIQAMNDPGRVEVGAPDFILLKKN